MAHPGPADGSLDVGRCSVAAYSPKVGVRSDIVEGAREEGVWTERVTKESARAWQTQAPRL
jgi:hypothetical protein